MAFTEKDGWGAGGIPLARVQDSSDKAIEAQTSLSAIYTGVVRWWAAEGFHGKWDRS